ncbi:MAG TPA: transposase [Spirillospora sp.]|nr:transposase [Spirillospora sp.]
MMTPAEAREGIGTARYAYRLRLSSTAERDLLVEWDRCRWVWNECVARSRAAHRAGEACGPARLDKMLTGWRAERPWLRAGASVAQQQTVRDFARSRAKALADIKNRVPAGRRAGMPRFKKLARYQRQMARRRAPKGKARSKGYREAQRQAAKACKKAARQRRDDARKWAKKVLRDHDAVAVEDFRPRFLAKSSMARKAADAAIGETKKALIEMGRKHARDVRLVNPAHTTMDCGECGARAKHRLPLSERTYTCVACGTSRPRDKNSARVMLVRAGLAPDGADGTRPSAPQGRKAA